MPVIKSLSPTYKAPVTFTYLDENGKLEEVNFNAQFKRAKQADLDTFFALPREDRPTDSDLLKNWLTGWDLNQPYSAEKLEELCADYAGLRSALAFAWLNSAQRPTAAAHAEKN